LKLNHGNTDVSLMQHLSDCNCTRQDKTVRSVSITKQNTSLQKKAFRNRSRTVYGIKLLVRIFGQCFTL